MDLIYKVNTRRDLNGKPIINQMETHGAGLEFFELRFVHVWATSLTAARAIQRDFRADLLAL